MLPYKFTPSVFLRAAVYSCESFHIDNLQQVLDKEFFRKALYFASEGLYRQAELKDFVVKDMSAGMQQSLLKYYNRMSYRVTPFGMFASFTSVPWDDSNNGLMFNNQEKLSVLLDFRLSVALTDNKGSPDSKEILYSNPTIYKSGKDLRYIKTGRDSEIQGIAATENNGLLNQVLHYTRHGVKPAELTSFLGEICPDEDPAELVEELLSEELILSSFAPNVTGENYFQRISRVSNDGQLSEISKTLAAIHSPSDVDLKMLDHLVNTPVRDEKIRSPFYVNYEKKADGAVSEKYQQTLLEGLNCLSRLQPENMEGSLDRFKNSFRERFEDREIPLMHALDPEMGIGYEQLEEAADTDDLLKEISFTRKETKRQIAWGPVHELLLRKISIAHKGSAVLISDHDLNSLAVTDKIWPPGISIMFRIIDDDKIFIEQAGGAGAISLIGRFTPFSEKILQEARDIADAEQAQNPDVIFAEIAYFSEEHAANINTREVIRKYEIPVLVSSTLPPEQIVNLNDLYISLRNDQLVLRSDQLNKRVIPRLSTAYNHVRSELPAFRFLCDLQYQGIHSRLGINPENLIPGLRYYPRIEYKNCILSEAVWILTSGDLYNIPEGIGAYESFCKLAEDLKISRHFALSSSDRQLVFDLQDADSIRLFLTEARNVKSVTIKEFFVPSKDKAFLKNKEGKPYIHQLLATLTCTDKTYHPVPGIEKISAGVKRDFSPADEWIYYKIYCSSRNSNDILISKIYPIVKKYLKSKDIDKWFFIRYYDPQHHLRIRIRGSEKILKEIPVLFNKALKSLMNSGFISNIQVDSYKREIERYGSETIDLTEDVFRSSSDLIVSHLSKESDEIQTVQFAVFSADLIFNAFDFDFLKRIDLLEQITRSLMNELGDEKIVRDDLNKKFRVYQQAIWSFMEGSSRTFTNREKRLFNTFNDDLISLKQKHQLVDPESKTPVGDILHMHMNRIFSADQRKRELVIYYLCLRFYLSLKARKKSGS